jgi:class 3 adenylate cyclase
VQWFSLLVVSPLCLAVGGISLLFLGSGYVRSDEQERQRILWVILGIVLAVGLASTWTVFDYFATLWGFEPFRSFYVNTRDFVVPVAAFVLLTGFAVGVLASGAFDVRPLVDKTVLYGLLGVALLFGFGAIEFTLSEVVMTRVGAPSGASSWLAGGVVAIAFGPLRKSFKKRVDGWLRDALPATKLAEGPRHQTTIVFCDIVGYTKLVSQNEDEALTMLSIFHQVARKAATKWDGTAVKTMGDGILMQFKEAQAAVEAVQALSSAFHAALLPLGLPDGRLRTSIHYGLVATGRDGDLFGGAVNLASRLERAAEPGQIVLSQTAADHLEDEIELEDLGERALKNVARPVQCWAIRA